MQYVDTTPKKKLRKYLKEQLKSHAKRSKLTLGLLNRYYSYRLLKHFVKFYNTCPHLNRAQIIALYAPLFYEIDCSAIVQWLWRNKVSVALPKIQRDSKILHFCSFDNSKESQLNHMGIKEPVCNHVLTPDVILVPLIGFDSRGYRLGHGGGYYDQTITALRNSANVFTAGIAYSWQQVPDVHPDSWDIKLDAIITNRYYKIFDKS